MAARHNDIPPSAKMTELAKSVPQFRNALFRCLWHAGSRLAFATRLPSLDSVRVVYEKLVRVAAPVRVDYIARLEEDAASSPPIIVNDLRLTHHCERV